MKAILISIHAKWCAKIMNGDKTIEVRKGTALYKATKKLIDEYGFAEFYVYCFKINRKHYHLIESMDTDTGKTYYEIDYYIGSEDYLDWCFDGKVAFKFRCYKVEELTWETENLVDKKLKGIHFIDDRDFEKTCLTYEEYENYLEEGKTGTAIHISDLEIFDKPKELSEFYKCGFDEAQSDLAMDLLLEDDNCPYEHAFIKLEPQFRLTKAPQSWQFIEVGE